MLNANRRSTTAHQRRGPAHPRATSPINARNNYERYIALAQVAARSGDKIQTENYYQHADHYFRLMRATS